MARAGHDGHLLAKPLRQMCVIEEIALTFFNPDYVVVIHKCFSLIYVQGKAHTARRIVGTSGLFVAAEILSKRAISSASDALST